MDEIEVLPGVRATRDYALYLEEPRALVVADLHLGYEGALRQQGVSLPRFQRRHIQERLGALLDRYDPAVLVVDGDFKHAFDRNLNAEWREVMGVLTFLEGRTEVVLVRGNHDNYLKTILSQKGLVLHDAWQAGGFTIAHGHEAVDASGPLILGHEHPALRLKDQVGAGISLPCFLASREVIVLPAFSPLAYGSDVLRGPHLSPLLSRGLIQKTRVYGLDDQLGILDFGPAPDLRRRRG